MKTFTQFKKAVKAVLKEKYKQVYDYKLAFEEYQDNEFYFEVSWMHSYNGNPIIIE